MNKLAELLAVAGTATGAAAMSLAAATFFGLAFTPTVGNAGQGTFIRQVKLNPSEVWEGFENPDAFGTVTVFSGTNFEMDLRVNGLRCLGPAFNFGQWPGTADRIYEFRVNNNALFKFNPTCNYANNNGIQPFGLGGGFYTVITIKAEVKFPVDTILDDLTVDIVLLRPDIPDEILALTGTDPAN